MKRDRAPEHAGVLLALMNALLRCPDLRIGQLIVNALPPEFANDAFYIEDDALAEALDKFARAHETLASRAGLGLSEPGGESR